MRSFAPFSPVTRRGLRVYYTSPALCHRAEEASGSSNAYPATLEIQSTERLSGPPSISAGHGFAGEVFVDWPVFPGSVGYVLYRATAIDGPFTIVATAISDTFYLDTGLGDGTYFYKVTALETSFGETFPSPVSDPVTLPS